MCPLSEHRRGPGGREDSQGGLAPAAPAGWEVRAALGGERERVRTAAVPALAGACPRPGGEGPGPSCPGLGVSQALHVRAPPHPATGTSQLGAQPAWGGGWAPVRPRLRVPPASGCRACGPGLGAAAGPRLQGPVGRGTRAGLRGACAPRCLGLPGGPRPRLGAGTPSEHLASRLSHLLGGRTQTEVCHFSPFISLFFKIQSFFLKTLLYIYIF